jgi:hypothetical protein
VLGHQSFEAINQWVLDRSVFSAPLAAAGRIELSAVDRSLALVRAGDRFNQEGPGGRLSRSQIDELVDELQALSPEAAIHLGAPLAAEGFSRPTLTLVAKDPSGAQRVGWKIGAADVWRNISIYYGRVEGVNATYVFARGPIERALGAL